ncbi:MAG: PGPGW domain-containing protein [Gammaproteobacteria bacterium]|nr:PGPGW domain-containing protein [Gammaproteobacteria bacterium]
MSVSTKNRIKRILSGYFYNVKDLVSKVPVGQLVKKVFITIVGGIVTLIGIAFIILPGPAFILLPAGLAILALEYPIAKVWLRKAQKAMTKGAEKADGFLASIKNRLSGLRQKN